jgi:hypothetical protein
MLTACGGGSLAGPEQVVQQYFNKLITRDCTYLDLETPASLAHNKESVADCKAGKGTYFSVVPSDASGCTIKTGPPGIAGRKAVVGVRITCYQHPTEGGLQTIALQRVGGTWYVAGAN